MGKPVAVYGISNNMALLIFEANSEQVLAGTNFEEAEWCPVDYIGLDEDEMEAVFIWGEMEIPLSHCFRLN
jgi:hypothetical protein